MDIITVKQALALGLTHYYTGKPCKHGHVAKRFVGSGACSECLTQNRHARQVNWIRRMTEGDPFTYMAHPDDHAALRAYAIALDLQRGRTPGPPVELRPPPAPFDYYAEWVRIYGQHAADIMMTQKREEEARRNTQGS